MTGAAAQDTVRPATPDDVAALTELWREVDTEWFGAPEHDEGEVAEELDRLVDLQRDSRLTFDGDRLVAAVLRGRHESSILVRPGVAPDRVHDDALRWVTQCSPSRVEVLARDADLLAALTVRRWHHSHSSFELSRSVTDDWPAQVPTWPEGVELCDARDDDLEDVHRLIYVDARWADVPGHAERAADEWRRLFVGDRAPRDAIVLARRAQEPIGVALVRTFSDGMGWVSQLAVVTGERGRGLGRALLVESFRRLVTGGATSLGLGVMAGNRDALALYVRLGLEIDREWQLWDPSGTR